MVGTQWRMYKAMVGMVMEAINMRKATKVGDPMCQMNHTGSPSTPGRGGQDRDARQEEGCLSPCTHSHSDPQAVSRVGDTQIWVPKWQK